jgi:cation transport ATPase
MITKWYFKRQFAKIQPELAKDFSISSPADLLALANLKRIIFTTTDFFYAGEPVVRQFFAVEDQTMATKERVLHLAASLARSSKNPAVHVIARMAYEAGQPVREVEVDAISAYGVTAKLDRGWYVLGDEEAMQQEAIELGVSIQALARQFEKEGKYTLFLAQRQPKRLLGIFACEYPLRPQSADVVTALESLGLELVLLSGAKTVLARSVGRQLGISLVHSELQLADKQEIIQDLSTQQPSSAIVVPAKSGFEAPLKIVVRSDIKKGNVAIKNIDALPVMITLARATVRKVRKRLFWAKL